MWPEPLSRADTAHTCMRHDFGEVRCIRSNPHTLRPALDGCVVAGQSRRGAARPFAPSALACSDNTETPSVTTIYVLSTEKAELSVLRGWFVKPVRPVRVQIPLEPRPRRVNSLTSNAHVPVVVSDDRGPLYGESPRRATQTQEFAPSTLPCRTVMLHSSATSCIPDGMSDA